MLCDICGYQTNHSSNLKRHKLCHVPKDEKEIKEYLCQYCAKKFITRYGFSKHMKLTHTNQAKFVCKEPGCNARYMERIEFEHHLASHRNDYSAVCYRCGKKFLYNKNLKKHLRICGKSGSQNDAPNVPDQMGNYRCACGKEFSWRSELHIHRQDCASFHGNRSIYQQSVATKGSASSYKCACGCTYSSSSTLSKHKKKCPVFLHATPETSDATEGVMFMSHLGASYEQLANASLTVPSIPPVTVRETFNELYHFMQ